MNYKTSSQLLAWFWGVFALSLLSLTVTLSAQSIPFPGPGWKSAFTPTARLFNGTTDWAHTTAGVSTTPLGYVPGAGNQAGAWTVCWWMKSANVAQAGTWLFVTSNNGAPFHPVFGYGIVNDGAGHDQIKADSSTTPGIATGSEITILDTNWHHVCYRHAGAAGSWDKFLDGSKTVINATMTIGNSRTQAMSFPQNNCCFSGSLARLIVSNIALTDAQITTLATTCLTAGILAGFPTDEAGYWLFNNAASPQPDQLAQDPGSGNAWTMDLVGTTVSSGPPSCTGL